MQVSKVSFSGYQETHTVLHSPDQLVLDTLDNAKPYLKQIGESMPYPRDLVILVRDNGCDTFINAYDHNIKNQKTKLLASRCEHELSGHGLDFVQKVFEGLKKNNEKEFKDIASNFVLRLNSIMWEQHPIKYPKSIDNFDCDSHPACCGY